jgi:hypothetical protein
MYHNYTTAYCGLGILNKLLADLYNFLQLQADDVRVSRVAAISNDIDRASLRGDGESDDETTVCVVMANLTMAASHENPIELGVVLL